MSALTPTAAPQRLVTLRGGSRDGLSIPVTAPTEQLRLGRWKAGCEPTWIQGRGLVGGEIDAWEIYEGAGAEMQFTGEARP